jgi:phenylalanyl-tRNA synthetase beta chain
MKFTLSWLKDHLETNADLDTIAETLTAIGLEVEKIDDPGAQLAPFIVAEIISAEKHPDADRLKLCRVSTGDEEIQVVCGAPNARAGFKGILARPGDIIPASGDVLKVGKIRGIASEGMMCSSRELQLGEDHDGIIELPLDSIVGTSAAEALSLEQVIDLALTPNRVDALGVRGVARDLAASGLGTLKPIDVSPVQGSFDSPRGVAMGLPKDKLHLCPHFVGRTIRGIKNTDSPAWLAKRLIAIGLRPVSAIVDITQYLNIDLGRPLHAFDAAKLNGYVGPRLAEEGETIAALNGSEYTLQNSMLVISDESDALAIAGVMGGEPSSCTENTTEIFLESALFDPINIANTGRSLAIISDARYCFERGVDPASTHEGTEIATRMILEICGGKASHIVVGGSEPDVSATVSFRPTRVFKLGGVAIDDDDIRSILERLGFIIATESREVWSVTAPSWRRDVEGEHDLIEEVLRIHGYDSIPIESIPRPAVVKPAFSSDQCRIRLIRRSLAGRGLNETTTWSFLSKEHANLFNGETPLASLENPISAELDVMRPSLIPNLVAAAGRNAARALPNAALFEIGPRFVGGEPGDQTLIACGLRSGENGPRHWHTRPRPVDAFDAKADAMAVLAVSGLPLDRIQTDIGPKGGVPPWYHPGQSGVLRLGPNVLAEFGILHPLSLKGMDVDGPMAGFEVFIERLPSLKRKANTARTKFLPSAFQPVERDFAFLIDRDTPSDFMVRAVKGVDKMLISAVDIFDVYEGEKIPPTKKSVALSVRLEPTETTLTDAEIEDVSQKIVAAVEKAVSGQLRS